MKQCIKQFFLPKITNYYLKRVLIVAFVAFCLFNYVLIPIRIHGGSMEPAYSDGSFNFCFKLRYLLENPKRFDVVGIRMAGEKVILLKRIVALGGEMVEIRNGVLYVNNTKIYEPYLQFSSDWNLSPRMVKQNHVYVIGDNRSVPMHIHRFGQTAVTRIIGAPLW